MSLPLRSSEPTIVEAPQRPLRAVESAAPRRRPTLVYGIVAVAVAAAIAAAQMGLSILTTQSSYTLAELTQKQAELSWQTQVLQEEIGGLDSPQFLAANAAALGMVIDQAPAYLRLSDASIVGDPGTSAFASNVDPLSSAVPNALVAQVPLITDPNSTIASARAADATPAPVDPQTPPPIADVLPIPATH